MENTLFNFNGNNLTVIVKDNEPWFVAKEIALLLGYTNTSKAIKDNCKGSNQQLLPSSGGKQITTIIPERDLYRLVIRSKMPKALEFEEWVVSVVLPSIRKHGIYATDNTIDNILNDPDFGIKLLQNLKEEREAKNKALEKAEKAEKIIKKLEPKAEFATKVFESTSTVDIGQACKILGLNIGRNKFFKFLRDEGVFFKSRNEPKQSYMAKGLFEIKEVRISKSLNILKTKVLVTQKGLDFLLKLCTKHCLI